MAEMGDAVRTSSRWSSACKSLWAVDERKGGYLIFSVRIFFCSWPRFLQRKGGLPVSISKSKMPKLHQSAGCGQRQASQLSGHNYSTRLRVAPASDNLRRHV